MKYSTYNLVVPCGEEVLLFNTLSGETFLIDDETKRCILSNEIDELDPSQKEEFLKRRIIVEDSYDETKVIDYYHNKTKYGSSNLTYTLLLTWACNLRCVYCYEGAGDSKSYSMSQDTADRITQHIIRESIERGSRTIGIILFGGEPLLNYKIGKYVLEKLKEHCDQHNMELYTAIVTNGTLLNDDIIEDLIKFNCKFVQITLDGIEDIHNQRRVGKNGEGTFELIIRNLEKLNEYKERLQSVIRVNVDKTNIHHMPELLNYLRNKGLNNMGLDFGIVRGSTEVCQSYDDKCYVENELGDLLSDLWNSASDSNFRVKPKPLRKWTYCGLNNDNNFTIEPNGDVYKCWEHTGLENHRIGKIGEQGYLEDIQYAYFDWMTKNPLSIEACKNCVYLPACGGGCGSVSYGDTGEYNREGCLKIKGVIEEQVKNWYTEMKTNRM